MAIQVRWGGWNEAERDERIVKAVLEDEFRIAAEEYADALVKDQDLGEIGSIGHLMRLRERMMNARRMQLAR